MRKYDVIATKRYKKDYRCLRRSSVDIGKLEYVIDQLACGEILADRYRDHALKGELKGTRACHIGPDWLLRYKKESDQLLLLLLSTGDHRRVLWIE